MPWRRRVTSADATRDGGAGRGRGTARGRGPGIAEGHRRSSRRRFTQRLRYDFRVPSFVSPRLRGAVSSDAPTVRANGVVSFVEATKGVAPQGRGERLRLPRVVPTAGRERVPGVAPAAPEGDLPGPRRSAIVGATPNGSVHERLVAHGQPRVRSGRAGAVSTGEPLAGVVGRGGRAGPRPGGTGDRSGGGGGGHRGQGATGADGPGAHRRGIRAHRPHAGAAGVGTEPRRRRAARRLGALGRHHPEHHPNRRSVGAPAGARMSSIRQIGATSGGDGRSRGARGRRCRCRDARTVSTPCPPRSATRSRCGSTSGCATATGCAISAPRLFVSMLGGGAGTFASLGSSGAAGAGRHRSPTRLRHHGRALPRPWRPSRGEHLRARPDGGHGGQDRRAKSIR